ncbi:MAG: hypothetical protein WAL67_01940 [Candidatus Cybelea sp.]
MLLMGSIFAKPYGSRSSGSRARARERSVRRHCVAAEAVVASLVTSAQVTITDALRLRLAADCSMARSRSGADGQVPAKLTTNLPTNAVRRLHISSHLFTPGR